MTSSNDSNLKKIISFLLVIVLIVGYGLILYKIEYGKLYDRDVSCLMGYNNEVCEYLSRKAEFRKEYRNMHLTRYYEGMLMAFMTLDNMTYETIVELDSITTAEDFPYSMYVLNKNKEIISEKSKEPLGLVGSELDAMLINGKYETEDSCYLSKKIDDGYYVLSCRIDLSEYEKISLEYPGNTPFYIFDPLTYEIIETNNEDEIKKVSEQYSINKLQEVTQYITSDIIIESDDSTSVDELIVFDTRYVSVVKYVNIDNKDYGVCSFIELESTIRDALLETLLSVAMSVIFAFLVMKAILEIQKCVKEGHASFEVIKIGKIWSCEKQILKNYMSSAALMGIFTLTTMLFVHTLSDIIHINIVYNESQKSLATSSQVYEKNAAIIYDESYQSAVGLANDLVYSLTYDLTIDKNEMLRQYASVLKLEEISVFDENGVIEYSTTPYIGYSLPTKENEPRYQLWDILNNGVTDMAVTAPNSEYTDIAVRRVDSVGIFMARVPISNINTLLAKLNYSKLLSIQEIEDTDKIYSLRSEPDTLYIYKNGSYSEKSLKNNLPMTEEGESFIGVRTVDNNRYLLNNYGDENAVTTLAYPISILLSDAAVYLLISLILYFCISLVLIFGFGSYVSDAETCNVNNDVYLTNLDQKHRDITINSLPFITVLTAIVVLIRIYASPYSSSIVSLMYKWEKSINIISISTILFSLGVTIGTFFLISFINKLFSRYLSPQGSTICSMVCSIIKAILLVSFAIGALEQIGVNTTAITAGLGLTGLAVGIGSKDIINDLVAGIFIILEGQIRVGDHIQVGNVSGIVKSLGIRTTKIESYGKEMLINNSNLNNVINDSKNLLSSGFIVPVEIGTNTEIISEIVRNSSERINKATKNLIVGDLKYAGINGISNLGIECLFVFNCNSNNEKKIRRYCYSEIIKLLEENGIQIARETHITLN